MLRPVICCRGDRFLIRNHGEDLTLGGGTVLDPRAPSRGKSIPARLQYLNAMESPGPAEALAKILLECNSSSILCFILAWNIREDETAVILSSPLLRDQIKIQETGNGTIAVSQRLWTSAGDDFLRALDSALKREQDTTGVALAQVAAVLQPKYGKVLIDYVFNALVRDGKVMVDNGLLQLAQRQVSSQGRGSLLAACNTPPQIRYETGGAASHCRRMNCCETIDEWP
jgi:selenocysteine-specific elongation factor